MVLRFLLVLRRGGMLRLFGSSRGIRIAALECPVRPVVRLFENFTDIFFWLFVRFVLSVRSNKKWTPHDALPS